MLGPTVSGEQCPLQAAQKASDAIRKAGINFNKFAKSVCHTVRGDKPHMLSASGSSTTRGNFIDSNVADPDRSLERAAANHFDAAAHMTRTSAYVNLQKTNIARGNILMAHDTLVEKWSALFPNGNPDANRTRTSATSTAVKNPLSEVGGLDNEYTSGSTLPTGRQSQCISVLWNLHCGVKSDSDADIDHLSTDFGVKRRAARWRMAP